MHEVKQDEKTYTIEELVPEVREPEWEHIAVGLIPGPAYCGVHIRVCHGFARDYSGRFCPDCYTAWQYAVRRCG